MNAEQELLEKIMADVCDGDEYINDVSEKEYPLCAAYLKRSGYVRNVGDQWKAGPLLAFKTSSERAQFQKAYTSSVQERQMSGTPQEQYKRVLDRQRRDVDEQLLAGETVIKVEAALPEIEKLLAEFYYEKRMSLSIEYIFTPVK